MRRRACGSNEHIIIQPLPVQKRSVTRFIHLVHEYLSMSAYYVPGPKDPH